MGKAYQCGGEGDSVIFEGKEEIGGGKASVRRDGGGPAGETFKTGSEGSTVTKRDLRRITKKVKGRRCGEMLLRFAERAEREFMAAAKRMTTGP